MALYLLQLVAVVLIAGYLRHRVREQKRRNTQTWSSLIAHLRIDWSARELCEDFLWKDRVIASPEDAWHRMEGPHGLWIMYHNARVMLEMADYATSHNTGETPVDPMQIESLRTDAMQIRLCVFAALTKYAFAQVGAGARVNAYRAARLYSSMAMRMTELLQEHAAIVLPDFIAAM